ncbi:MAG: DUF1440 domain-containing protein [Chloroflexi bacterium]|nr:DUF1440 domain-containing protein [Chloroflexota bacterium]
MANVSPTSTDWVKGAAAGFAATAPMTVAMEVMQGRLPWWQRGPLPPTRITERVAHRLGFGRLSRTTRRIATTVSHFSYGAAIGMLYAMLARWLPFPATLGGVIYALGVWASSYLGWLPALKILGPATRRPLQRNLLMIGAHVVWGAVAAKLFQAMREKPDAA